jgi:hypothetical protein
MGVIALGIEIDILNLAVMVLRIRPNGSICQNMVEIVVVASLSSATSARHDACFLVGP